MLSLNKYIVLSCENQDASSLVKNVDNSLTLKLVEAINNKRKNMGQILLEGKHPKTDPYEKYEPKIREAIDYVVESVLEGGLELENTILMAAKQYNIDDRPLKEYFDTFLETTKTEVKVDSTSSNDEDDKGGVRDDEDTNKRVRYESYTIVLEDGNKFLLTEDFWKNNIDPVLNRLNEENQRKFLSILTENKVNFMRAVEFCQRAKKQ